MNEPFVEKVRIRFLRRKYIDLASWSPLICNTFKVIVTTYQTLNGDFAIPKDVDPTEEAEWLSEYG